MAISVTGLSDPSGLPGSSRLSMREALKEKFLPAQEDYLASHDAAITGLIGKKDTERLEGRQAVFYASTNRPQGIGARGERNRLPTATASKGINGYLTPHKSEGRLELTPELEADARGGDSSWVVAFTNELEGIQEQMEMELTEPAVWGRAGVKGRIQTAPVAGTGVTVMYGRNNRGATAARFFDRGMSTNKVGPANQPFFEGMRLSTIPVAQGFNGQPHDHATDNWASGDIGDDTVAQEVYIGNVAGTSPLDGSNTDAPTITVIRNGAVVDLSIPGAAGGWLIPYGQRKLAPTYTDAANDINHYHSTEGMASFLAGSSIYSAIYGNLKSASQGFQAGYSTGATAGEDRQVSSKLVEFAIRQSGMLTGGGSPSYVGVLTFAQWAELAKENENGRRFEPVLGSGGTTITGNTPEGYRYIGGGGGAVYKPTWAAMHKCIMFVTPEHWSYMENMPLHMLEPDGRIVADYDTTQYVWMRRGNFKCNRIMRETMTDDLTENEFAPTA